MKAERFSASWCNPCKQFAPTWDFLVDKYDLDATVWDLETAEGMQRASELGIKSIPAVALDGQLVHYTSLQGILQKVNA